MQITTHTRFLDVAAYMQVATDDTLARIRKAAPVAVFGDGGYYTMTLGQFGALLQGAEPLDVVAGGTYETLTVFEYYAIEGMADFVRQYAEMLKRFTPQPIAGESVGNTVQMTAAEALLVFARKYFALPSFQAAEQITLGDLLIAKKDAYNEIMVQRAQIARLKKGGKK